MAATAFEPSVLFHIGFHKTGTTWLQRQVFTPRLDFQQVMNHRDVRRLLTGPNRLVFDPRPARSHIERKRNGREGTQPVVSSELLCGNPFSGNRELADFADRIRAIHIPTKILITIREQRSVIVATYGQYVRRGGTLRIEEFLEAAPVGFEGFDADVFRYDRVLDLYRTLFGPSAVCVIAHEAMRSRRLDELNGLRRFCGLSHLEQLPSTIDGSVNVSTPEAALAFDRRLNRFRRSSATPNPIANLGRATRALSRANGFVVERSPRNPSKSGRPVSAYVDDRLQDHFQESNRRLQKLLGGQYDLREFGYQL